MTDIFFDGKYVGRTDKPEEFVRGVRSRRRSGEISTQVNIAYHTHLNEIEMTSDSGRVRRPLIIVEDGKPLLTEDMMEQVKRGEINFESLVKAGVIEFLDANEEENTYMALRPENVS